jgi:hypothetical protein
LPLVLKIIESKNTNIDAFILAILLKNLNIQKTNVKQISMLKNQIPKGLEHSNLITIWNLEIAV